MARAKVIHSEDAVMIKFMGNPKKPEPSTAVISFPGGEVEVTRCSDNSYWAHIYLEDPVNNIGSRLTATPESRLPIEDIPNVDHVKQIAVRVAATVRKEDYS
jgi:hypothetical protein